MKEKLLMLWLENKILTPAELMKLMTRDQCRAARTLLHMTQPQPAKKGPLQLDHTCQLRIEPPLRHRRNDSIDPERARKGGCDFHQWKWREVEEDTEMTAQIIPVDPDNARTLARHATEIRRLGKQVVSDVIEIGRLLVESKELVGHGNWLSWLEREFQWTDDTALNYMRVHELAKNRNFRDLSNIPLSGLFLLAAPSTPETAKQEAIGRAEAGEPIPLNTVKEIVGRASRLERRARRCQDRDPRRLYTRIDL
jgi:hypothetical protein